MFKREAHQLQLIVILLASFACPSSCQKNDSTAPAMLAKIVSRHAEANSTKKILTIPVLAPLMGVNADRFGYAVAARYAMDMINNRSDILKDYYLVPQIHDTVVSSQLVAVCMVVGKTWRYFTISCRVFCLNYLKKILSNVVV